MFYPHSFKKSSSEAIPTTTTNIKTLREATEKKKLTSDTPQATAVRISVPTLPGSCFIVYVYM